MTQNILNFFPIIFSSKTVNVFAGRRGDEMYRKSLINQYPNCVTWPDKTDGDRLYLWSTTDPDFKPLTEFAPVTVELDENPFLFERLLQDAVEARLQSAGFTKRGYRDFVNFSKGNLLEKVEPLNAALKQPIGIYPKIIVDAYFTAFSEKSLLLGLVVDVLYTTRVEIPLNEILAAGADLSGYNVYVKLHESASEAKDFPELVGRTIGKIAHTAGDWADLEDCRDEKLKRVRTNSVMLEPRREYLDAYLEARYEQNFSAGKQQIADKFKELISPAKKYQLIKALVDQRLMLAGDNGQVQPLVLLPGLTAQLAKMQAIPASQTEFPVRYLQPPTYSFDPTANQFYSGRVDDGLRIHKPYSKRKFRDKQHHILVVAPEQYKGTVQQALAKLRSGIKIPKQRAVFTGLQDMYDLTQLHIEERYCPLNQTAPMRSYQDALQQALIETGTTITYDLALIVIEERFKRLPDSENPYYQCKAFLLAGTSAIPTQNLTIEKLRQGDYNLQFILNTVALACYAKMGGTPFVLQTSNEGPSELVFGVGRSIVKESRYGGGEQTIGFSTVFRANGEYIYNDSTPYCDIEDYSRQLEKTIRRTVEQVASFEQLKDGAELRLIFHIFKTTGKKEVDAITNAIGKLTRYKIEYALIHVSQDHHFHIFDYDCDGAMKGYGEKSYKDTSSALIPRRGLVVTLGKRERLVTIIGPEQYRGYGCPSPIRMTLDKSSTYLDIDDLARQLFDLSFMNARSLNPAIKPVTILYSEFLADVVGHLRGVQNWSVELIQQKLGQRLWFI